MLKQSRDSEVYMLVVELGSITKAADQLGMSKANVSRVLSRMERMWGADLLIRSTRSTHVTEAGRLVYNHCVDWLNSIQSVREEVDTLQGVASGEIRIAASSLFSNLYLVEPIERFLQLYPKVRIALIMDGKHEFLVEGGYDLAFRFGPLEDSTLRSRVLRTTELGVYASPSYLKNHGTPEKVADLKEHSCLVYTAMSQPYNWGSLLDTVENLRVNGNFESNSEEILVQMACRGKGLLFFPKVLVQKELDDKRLVRVLPDVSTPFAVNIVYPFHKELPYRIRLFIDYMRSHSSV
ncbi:LysR family transcriptional regulator [Thiomicrorhabdus heinhorstiae]|uniref:LysR family transcriptional regulator n=1 Tax=Thiomicrorhabdus heinhorstiae TaxID=2748010 RepID=A0ABS0BYV7_9GAMM|nr:LysR family transcriptional regulator [Thiomicrorhabdus heinhorstiae]MBF6058977.1 LysR family transcriptional regulator [Thiomicrorhabdus heinhorstiae]